jgi:hypothetical protein
MHLLEREFFLAVKNVDMSNRVRVFFHKPIKDRRLQLWLLVYFGYRRGNYIIWRGSAIVGLDVDSRDWLQLVHSCEKSKVERRALHV